MDVDNQFKMPKPRAAAVVEPEPPTIIAPTAPEPDVIDVPDVIEPPTEAAPEDKVDPTPKEKKTKVHWWNKLQNKWRSLSKKQKIIISVVAVIVLVLLAGGAYILLKPSKKASTAGLFIKAPTAVAKPKTVASPLTGVQVAPALAARPVTAVMIENSDAARPQSGLQDAGIVFEAIAEGGVTRFMALFQDTSPQYLGPIRSLRPYYIDYAAPFQASIVHVGGSPDALNEVTSGAFRNLDEFANGNSFTRITSRDAPHNVYTSFAALDALNASKGYKSSSFTPWPRKADKKLTTPTAKTIQLAIASSDFYANYSYSPLTNGYLRNEGGAPHLDFVTSADTAGVELSPKVVVALVVPVSNGALDATGAYYSNYADIGTGVAYVFQDGGVTTGAWAKSSTSAQLQLTDAQGKPIALNAGQTWVTLVSSASAVTYNP